VSSLRGTDSSENRRRLDGTAPNPGTYRTGKRRQRTANATCYSSSIFWTSSHAKSETWETPAISAVPGPFVK
jgi:hypothetical protein